MSVNTSHDLSPDQLKSFETIIGRMHDFIANPNQSTSTHSLLGYAGTGKTFLVGKLLQTIVNDISLMRGFMGRIGICAPTNKAVNVLSEKVEDLINENNLVHLNPRFGTIQAMLKMKYVKNDDGSNGFFFDQTTPRSEIPLNDHRLIIVDECSMIDKEIFDLIIEKVNETGTFIIFVGDPAQLPPVGESMSETFSLDPKSILTDIIRQDKDNPIIELSLTLRKKNKKRIQKAEIINLAKDLGIGFTTRSEVIEEIFGNPLELFDGDDDIRDVSNDSRILCYTNKMVDTYNYNIHRMLYGDDADAFSIGEKIIISQPYDFDVVLATINSRKKKVNKNLYTSSASFLTNNEECIITEKEHGSRAFGGKSLGSFPLFSQMRHMGIKNEDIDHLVAKTDVIKVSRRSRWESSVYNPNVLIFVSNDQKHVDRIVAELFSKWRIAKSKKRFSEAKNYSEVAWRLKETYCSIRHSYAMTIHKSQGSTFGKVYIDLNDVNLMNEDIDFNRCLYVAVTRPSDELFFIV